MSTAQELADRYVAVWNETDPAVRRKSIAELWTREGQHYARTLEARGYDELEKRITGSHVKNVRGGGYRFRANNNAQALRDVVTFGWEMLAVAGGDVAASGSIILVLDDQGRILTDYQFFAS
jgi:hypothetical protein